MSEKVTKLVQLRNIRAGLNPAEENLIRRIVRELGGDVGAIAKELGIDRSQLYRYMRRGRINLYGPARRLSELANVNPDLIADYRGQRDRIALRREEAKGGKGRRNVRRSATTSGTPVSDAAGS